MKDHIRKRLIINLWATYAGVAVLTFGHAFNAYKPDPRITMQEMARLYIAIPCAAAWPLYWSVKLQQGEQR